MPKILCLGAGYVAPPCIEYLLRRPENYVTIASRTLSAAERLAAQFRGNVTATKLDINDEHAFGDLVAAHDLVISLIPYIHHATVMKAALAKKKHVVTTSYVSPAMMAYDEEARAAGLTFLNEVGVDPGIDHFYALKTIDEVHAEGGKINSFISYCGGLPAPEASGNPLGYKFSWSPRGVLLALRNPAKFLEDGKVVDIQGPQLLNSAKPIFILPGFAVEGYANRDSTPYDVRYKIPEAQTILRGTLRYQGFPQFMQALVDLGFLNDKENSKLAPGAEQITWKKFLSEYIGAADDSEDSLKSKIVEITKLSGEAASRVIRGMKWLGLLSDSPVPPGKNTVLDSLCATLEEKLQYRHGERDMILMQHKFEIELADGTKQSRTSTMVEYGIPDGYTAMARTVGIPCAIAVQLILDGKITETGVLAPMDPKIYIPIMDLLKLENITMVEEIL